MRALLRQATILSLVTRVVAPCEFTPEGCCRYEDTITAQFYGHTHFDEFELFYDPYRRYRVTNVAYIGPSQSSYYQLNPGYRIYSMQGDYDGSQKVGQSFGTFGIPFCYMGQVEL